MSVNVKFSDLIKSYDGTGDFLEWVQKLELVAEFQKITELQNFLPLFLNGGAFAVYQGIPTGDKKDYKLVKRFLSSAFSLGPFKAFETFVTRRLREGESVDVYLAELKKLAGLVSDNIDEAWLKCAFVCGLPDEVKSQMQAACSLKKMDLDEVVEKARSLVGTREACFASATDRGRGLMQCFLCGGGGHMARECPSSSSGRGRRGMGGSNRGGGGGGDRACYSCGKSGHLSRSCPSRTDVSKNE